MTFQDTLKHPPPYPSVVLPPSGGYWIESPESCVDEDDVDIEVDETARIYRAHFLGYEHYNFYGTDEQVHPESPSFQSSEPNIKKKLYYHVIEI